MSTPLPIVNDGEHASHAHLSVKPERHARYAAERLMCRGWDLGGQFPGDSIAHTGAQFAEAADCYERAAQIWSDLPGRQHEAKTCRELAAKCRELAAKDSGDAGRVPGREQVAAPRTAVVPPLPQPVAGALAKTMPEEEQERKVNAR